MPKQLSKRDRGADRASKSGQRRRPTQDPQTSTATAPKASQRSRDLPRRLPQC